MATAASQGRMLLGALLHDPGVRPGLSFTPKPALFMPSTRRVSVALTPSLCPRCPMKLLDPGLRISPFQRQLHVALRMGT